MEQKLAEVFSMIQNIHETMFKTRMEFNSIQDLASTEKLDQFGVLLNQMNIDDPRLLEFFKDASYEDIVRKQLL